MRLKGTYTLTINGEVVRVANSVTNQGLAIVAQLLCGGLTAQAASLGLTDDGNGDGADTLESHPGWQSAADPLPVQLSAAGAVVTSTVASFILTADVIAGGCYLVLGNTLFSIAAFEPLPVVRGDTVKAQYELVITP